VIGLNSAPVSITEARERALAVLYRCSHDLGFKASGLLRGYPHIWARDSAITALGAALCGEPQLMLAFRSSLETLGAFQSELGGIPLNVDVAKYAVTKENAGAVDANLWFILGHAYYYLRTGDLAFLRQHLPTIERAHLWLRYQDMNDCGLLEVPEAGDWMDLFANRYNILYDNVLYVAVWRAMALIRTACGGDGASALQAAEDVAERINLLMWIDRCWEAEHFAERLSRLKSLHLEWYMLYHNVGTISSRPFYLPWVAFREYGDWLDSLGNLLAVLCGLPDTERGDQILRYMTQVGTARPFPTKAIYPPIFPGHKDWREYYRSRNLNLPHQYHNGGIWPFVGGFHVAALVRAGRHGEAEALLQSLANANAAGVEQPWEFNEWMHGETGQPMGYAFQAWSAAMYIYAYEALNTGRLPLFDELPTSQAVREATNGVPVDGS
jgi:GH15 family glucan-1,4-alpha-glucosidase